MYKKLVSDTGPKVVDSEGPYTFLPDLADPMPKPYGEIDKEVQFQDGSLVKQWTIKF